MSDARTSLAELLSELEQPAFDAKRVERSACSLAASLASLSLDTPRVELERIAVMHAALRALVERRHAQIGRSLDAVLRARARISRLTRPHDARTVVDLDA